MQLVSHMHEFGVLAVSRANAWHDRICARIDIRCLKRRTWSVAMAYDCTCGFVRKGCEGSLLRWVLPQETVAPTCAHLMSDGQPSKAESHAFYIDSGLTSLTSLFRRLVRTVVQCLWPCKQRQRQSYPECHAPMGQRGQTVPARGTCTRVSGQHYQAKTHRPVYRKEGSADAAVEEHYVLKLAHILNLGQHPRIGAPVQTTPGSGVDNVTSVIWQDRQPVQRVGVILVLLLQPGLSCLCLATARPPRA